MDRVRTLSVEQSDLLNHLRRSRPSVLPPGGRPEWDTECFTLIDGEMAVWFDTPDQSTGVFLR